MKIPFKLFVMERTLREPIKGMLIFCLIILFIGWGVVAMFPTWSESQGEALSEVGSEFMSVKELDKDNGTYEVAWMSLNDTLPFMPQDMLLEFFDNYSLTESSNSSMLDEQEVYRGNRTQIVLDGRTGGPYFYQLYILFEDPGNGQVMQYPFRNVSTEDIGKKTGLESFENLMDNPAYKAYAGGADIDIYSLKGFMVTEFFGFVPLMVGVYIAYLVAGVVSKEIEDKTADLVLATPLSRERFLIEKYIAMMMLALVIVGTMALSLYLGVVYIDTNEMTGGDILASTFIFYPLAMVIAGYSLILSVLFDEQKKAMGASLGVFLFTYALHLGSNISESLEGLKPYIPYHYANYQETLASGSMDAGDAGVLIAAGIVLFGIALYLFRKKEIYL